MAQIPRLSISSTTYTYYNRIFDDISDLFIYACTHGDYMLVYKLLQEGKVKADISNKMGKSGLQLAIENEHLEVVKILLDKIPYEQFRDALLLAIYLGHTNIANYILNHQTYRTFSGGFLDPIDPQAYDDSQFSSDTTPLILAAQYNRLLIVHHLLSKGHRIKKPHRYMCTCVECTTDSISDSFRQAQIRLSAYKGLASEVYIALIYPDPILQAFELGQELRHLAKMEHYYSQEYRKLANQLSIFVARLIDNVRGHEELKIVLNKTGLPHEEKYENLARFDLAIQYKEKPFVSHSNCQQNLMQNWYKNLSVIQNIHIFKRIIFYLGYMICFPFFSLIYYIYPKSKIGSLCQQPNLKFKAYIASYFIFIALIIASSYSSSIYLEKTESLSDYNSTIYTNYIKLIYQNNELKNAIIGIDEYADSNSVDSVVNCDISLRSMKPNPFEIAISIWIIGFVWNEIKQIASVGLRVYLKVPSNYVDCSMDILFIFYLIFLYSSMICTRISMNIFQSSNYWFHMARYETMSNDEKQYYIHQTRHILYWLNADRFYWKPGDLQNLAEAFYAMGNITSICRICFLLPVIAFVGPLQVMLDYCMINIAKWIGIILIFFSAFACSLYLIYSFFAAVVQQQNILLGSSLNMNSSTSTVSNNSQCPDYFYKLLNQSIPLIINNEDDDTSSSDSQDNTTFCEQSSNYGTYQIVGPYPAIYYFGESFGSTLKTTFFTLFGAIGDGAIDRGYELLTLSCYKPNPSTYLPGFENFVSNLGFILYGLFTFVCVTVLINTLIAMLEKTIEDIDDRADIEWKFARSKLYMEYIRDGDALPVPLNIFPSPTSIIKFVNRIKQMIIMKKFIQNESTKKTTGIKSEYSLHLNITNNHNNNNDNSVDDDPESVSFNNEHILKRKQSYVSNKTLTYKIVIERVIKRFLLYYKDPRLGLTETSDAFQVKEIKNDISSLHYELSNVIDEVDDMCSSLIQPMNKFNQDLSKCFNFEQIQQHLNSQKQ
ncbi:unnamed protein product [Adineta steineri]|uniref:Transient receptor ion channel domain-containing protein n=1 Tax=Adineta steineri TaxID=433720 RepID=A0A818TMH9_9BILA|nr:unnamed protein product [Adineta steineri]